MKKIADMLTEKSVSIITIRDDGTRHRCAYENSASGREYLIADEPKEIVSEVFAVWGDEPIIEEPTHVDIPVQGEDHKDASQQNNNVWDEMASAIKEGVNEV